MTYPCTSCISSLKKGRHKYVTYELEYSTRKQEFLEHIIPVLKEEYGIGVNIDEKIKNINPERTRILKKFLGKNNTPDPSKLAPTNSPQLKVTRGKLPEILAKDLLIRLENVKFTCRASLEEEDPDMPKRGTDNFGFVFKEVDGNISLEYIVVCEVKASESIQSPPSVIHVTKDSMFSALKDLSQLSKRLEKAITKSIDRLPAGEYFELICNIAVDIESQENLEDIKSKIAVVPFLLRKREYWTENDYGKFKTHDAEFDLSTIKYYILTVDYPLTDFADEVYSNLREN